jgi:hypothetical protein
MPVREHEQEHLFLFICALATSRDRIKGSDSSVQLPPPLTKRTAGRTTKPAAEIERRSIRTGMAGLTALFPFGSMFDDPICEGAFKTNVVTYPLGFDPFVL